MLLGVCDTQGTMKDTKLLLVAVAAFFQPVMTAQQPSSVFAFTHVAVVDVTAGRVVPDMTVVVADGRISGIGKSGSLRVPNGARLSDEKGKFLIPGLWDMHVHWYDVEGVLLHSADYLPLFLTNGVTGVREMAGRPMLHEWRKSINNGTLLAPRMVIASNILEGPSPKNGPESTIVRNESEARAAVRKSKAEGADFIKVYDTLSREAFFAIADESKKQGLPFAGHIAGAITAEEASDAGQKSIEHLIQLVVPYLNADQEFSEELRKAQSTGAPPPWEDPAKAGVMIRLLKGGFDQQRLEALFRTLVHNHTWEVPTLTVNQNTAFLNVASLQSDPRLEYMPDSLKSWWAMSADRSKRRTPEAIEAAKLLYQREAELVGMMSRAGVEILAGTDLGNPYTMPGFSLRDELILLVQAGLTPAQALRAATINPARFLGRDADLGTIDKGKFADLVLLDANPLQDIQNTMRINAVVADGRFLDRATLDEMLAKVASAASEAQKGGQKSN